MKHHKKSYKFEKQFEKMSPYWKRDRILKSLGFDSYQDYCDSELWKKEIRPKVIRRDKGMCCKCGKNDRHDSIQIHHTEYTKDNLSGKSLDGMVCACAGCHYRAEFTSKDKKRSLAQANAYLRKPFKHKIKKPPKKIKGKDNSYWNTLRKRQEGTLRKSSYLDRIEQARINREERLKRWESDSQ
jgi:hypothetical protein